MGYRWKSTGNRRMAGWPGMSAAVAAHGKTEAEKGPGLIQGQERQAGEQEQIRCFSHAGHQDNSQRLVSSMAYFSGCS